MEKLHEARQTDKAPHDALGDASRDGCSSRGRKHRVPDPCVVHPAELLDKAPTEKSANADLVQACIAVKRRHTSVVVKTVPYHKYAQLPETHDMAHRAMLKLRDKK